jgi:6-pyruvoyltetrahydropterin/6-carboxytetrahydropterin synthase
MLITRRVDFSASHVCRRADLSDAENLALYGAAANPNGHGHNYAVEVTLDGAPDPLTGMVFDLKGLKDVLDREVVGPMDHRFLNREVPPFDRVVPTVENVTREIWRRLEPQFGGAVRLANVRVYETEDLFADCTGAE